MGSPSTINMVLGILMPTNNIFLSGKQHGGGAQGNPQAGVTLAWPQPSLGLLHRLLETLDQLSSHHTGSLPDRF